MKRQIISLVISVIAAVLVAILQNSKGQNNRAAAHGDAPPSQRNAYSTNSERVPVVVTSVSDGDTLHVELDGKNERLRLLGIDTPEREPNEKANEDSARLHIPLKTLLQYGEQAAQVTKSLVGAGAKITIEFDVEQRDQYGRLLAYVYLQDGTQLNRALVERGYARLLTREPNTKYYQSFKTALSVARQERRGLWTSNILKMRNQ